MRRLRAWRYWPWLRDGLLAVALLLGIRAYQLRDAAHGAAPALVGPATNAAQLSLADYRGAPVLVHFWATWCPLCRAEQPNVEAVARDLPVLSVACESGDPEQVAAYARSHGITHPVMLDPEGALARRFGVRAYPTTFVIDGDGEIRHVEVGYMSKLGLRARMWLARL
jgi:thiol-disulfide isomerase/thioredoxin